MDETNVWLESIMCILKEKGRHGSKWFSFVGLKTFSLLQQPSVDIFSLQMFIYLIFMFKFSKNINN